jgi:flavin-binding protein dodecin
MAEPDYELIRVTGSSTKSIDDAIGRAIEQASERVPNPEWFELGEVRGAIREGRVARFQVVMTIGQRIDRPTPARDAVDPV